MFDSDEEEIKFLTKQIHCYVAMLSIAAVLLLAIAAIALFKLVAG